MANDHPKKHGESSAQDPAPLDEPVGELIDSLPEYLFWFHLMDRIDRNLVEGEVDALAADGNPVGYWKLWQRCREAELPIPTEVLAYLDRVAKGLLAFAATPRNGLDQRYKRHSNSRAALGAAPFSAVIGKPTAILILLSTR